jgi:hypothetical protein
MGHHLVLTALSKQRAILGTHLFGAEPIACPDLKQAQDEVLGLSNGPRMMELQ